MKKIIYRSLSHDPFFNIAFEHFLFNSYQGEEEILYLWQNDPSVIIGRFQNPWSECKLSLMRKKGINLVRRESGGGAVFHDKGTAIFSFFSPFNDFSSGERNYNYLIKTLANLEIEASKTSRNDISVNWQGDERKVSGNAFKKKGKVNLQHGTMLINTHLEELSEYLTPNPKKLQSKGIASIRSRIVNLKEIKSTLTADLFFKSLIKTFTESNKSSKEIPYYEINEDLLDHEPLLKKEYQYLKNPEWILGKTPEFNQLLEETFSFGSFTLCLEVDELLIKEVTIFSDALNVNFIENLEKVLKNSHYSEDGIKKAFKKLREDGKNSSFSENWIIELENWIVQSITD